MLKSKPWNEEPIGVEALEICFELQVVAVDPRLVEFEI